MILAGDVRDGDHVAISAKGGALTFNGRAATATPDEDAPDMPKGKFAIN
jgi:ATP-dependent Clp protease ATP-binding subunit ClpB